MEYPAGTYLLETHRTRGPRCVLEVLEGEHRVPKGPPIQHGKILVVCGTRTGYLVGAHTNISYYLVGAHTNMPHYLEASAYTYTVLTEEEVTALKLSAREE